MIESFPRQNSQPARWLAGWASWFLLVLVHPSPALGQTERAGASEQPSGTVDFDRHIRPILSDYCFKCHGPDDVSRQAELRLDVREGLFAQAANGPVVVPHRPNESELMRRVLSNDAEVRMPPKTFGRQLDANSIELLRRWIEEGASWRPHWAFQAPTRPPVQRTPRDVWANHPIDCFVAARRTEEGLVATPEADRETRLRRLSLDLTGLPPTREELDAFIADREENAWEKQVDRLLASPAYGERMAADWLDGARYADTSGYQNDGPRSMWRWRDWVIEAFNRNMPLDQFTMEQIAGDLIPDANISQKMATGFQRNHRGNAEGGIVPEEFAVEYVVDRIETTSAVWLGLTMGCARCHDHKYDPISQKEFYQLFAFFNNIPESGRAIKEGNSPPMMLTPTEEQRALLEIYDRQLAEAESVWLHLRGPWQQQQRSWEKGVAASSLHLASRWQPIDGLPSFGDQPVSQFFDFDSRESLAGTLRGGLRPDDDGANRADSPSGEEWGFAAGPLGSALAFDGTTVVEAESVGKFGYFDRFTLAAWIYPTRASGTVMSRMTDEWQGDGYSLVLEQGRLQLNLVKRWLDDALRVETATVIPLDRWTHVAALYDGTRKGDGIRFYVDGELQPNHVLLDRINQTFAKPDPFRIGGGHGPEYRFHGLIDEVSIHARTLEPEEVAMLATTKAIEQIARVPPEKRTVGERAKIDTYFLSRFASSEIRDAYERQRRLRDERRRFFDSLPSVMVMDEREETRPTFVLARGQYDQPLEAVERDVPSCLPGLPAQAPRNRLGFAQWLVAPEQPLTARVLVNRYWQLLFGNGLVKTAEDFGMQGERPSHPELLDWLAVEMRESGWDLKRMIKMMVMSATYQQASAGSAASWQRDPENRWLSRGPRVRLPAETVRDQALAASGLIARTIGGPSVKPYQPDGLWGEIATDADYIRSRGEDLYRRSLYTYWKRTVAPPGMQTLDAPSRETCVVRRSITNTPLQALFMMNEDGMVEAARALAERALGEKAPTLEKTLSNAFVWTLGRNPSPGEEEVLVGCYQAFERRFRADPAAAQASLSVGDRRGTTEVDPVELASLTAVASLILNLDEAITKE